MFCTVIWSDSQSYQHDFQMAYSFFFECFDSYCTMKDPRWKEALKYMVLMKVLKGNVEFGVKNDDQTQEMQALLQNHLVVERWSEDMEILRSIATAFHLRDLSKLNTIFKEISLYCMVVRSFTSPSCLFRRRSDSSSYTVSPK